MASTTYPGVRENDPESNQYPSRDLSVINQPAGAIEFINTKDEEVLMISYKDGSFEKYNKFSKDELCVNDRRLYVQGDSISQFNSNKIEVVDGDTDEVIYGDSLKKIGDVSKWFPIYQKIKAKLRPLHELKRLFEIKRTKKHNSIDQGGQQTKIGSYAESPADSQSNKVLISSSATKYIPATKGGPGRKIFEIEDPEESYTTTSAGEGSFGDFTSYGTGHSPSTQDGIWEPESKKLDIEKTRISIQKDLLELEKELGQNKHPSGGSEISTISKDKIEIVGLEFNDMESYRKDPFGKLVPAGVKIDPSGKSVYTQYKPSDLVELVSVDSLPGGKYVLKVGDEYKLLVGANGIDMKTVGPIEMYGSTIQSASQYMEFNSATDFNVKAKRIDLNADIISIRPNEHTDDLGVDKTLPLNKKDKTEIEKQLLLDCNVGITGNAIIKGGLHTEGNITYHSQTAPAEYHISETDFEFVKEKYSIEPSNAGCAGKTDEMDETVDKDYVCASPVKDATRADLLGGYLIGYCHVSCGECEGCFPVYSVLSPNCIMVHAHHHYYKMPPTKFIETDTPFNIQVGDNIQGLPLSTHDAIRAIGSRNNYVEPVLPFPTVHDLTNYTSVEKFGGSTIIKDCEPIEIVNGSMLVENQKEIVPDGSGIRQKEQELDFLIEKAKDWESKMEKAYLELQEKLKNIK